LGGNLPNGFGTGPAILAVTGAFSVAGRTTWNSRDTRHHICTLLYDVNFSGYTYRAVKVTISLLFAAHFVLQLLEF